MGNIRKVPNSPYWQLRYKDAAGKWMQISAKTTSERLALQKLGKLEERIRRGDRVKLRKHTLQDIAQDVVNDYRVNNRSSTSDLMARLNLHLLPILGSNTIAAGITPADVRRYIAQRKDDGASNGTINRELTALKRALHLAVEDGKLAHTISFKMLKEAPPKSGFFEEDEFVRLRAALPDHLKGFVTFGYWTGWRLGEVQNLRWQNVDFVAGEIRLFPGETKNDEGRVFPMIGELRAVLDEAKARATTSLNRIACTSEMVIPAVTASITPYVFTYVWRGRVRRIGKFRDVWAKACEAAGIPVVVEVVREEGKRPYKHIRPSRIFHDFRRTAVRQLVRSGVSERVAMTMTGHKTRAIFERYNIISGDDLREAARKLETIR